MDAKVLNAIQLREEGGSNFHEKSLKHILLQVRSEIMEGLGKERACMHAHMPQPSLLYAPLRFPADKSKDSGKVKKHSKVRAVHFHQLVCS